MTTPSPAPSRDRTATALRAEFSAAEVERQLESLRLHGDAVDDPELWLRTALSHRFKHMPIEAVQRCYCGSTEHRLLSRFVFWNLLGLRQCMQCGLLFVSPRLTAEAMSRIFNEFYFDIGNPEFWGQRREPIFREVIGHLRRRGCESVFDVGAAYGHFVAFAQREGLRAAGCDLSHTAVEWGREHLHADLHAASVQDVGMQDASFDAVVSLDTLYYAPDPLGDLRAMRRLVRPGGIVLLRLRNGRKTLARARKEGRKEVGREPLPAEHIWAFTPESSARLAEAAGMEVIGAEPAAYSRARAYPLYATWAALNRAAVRRGWLDVRTQNFNLLARRPH